MPNNLDLPDELAALIEKREQDDRRAANQASGEAGAGAAPGVERRSGEDRRSTPPTADPPPA
ncbi:MAG: hypothetical protein AAF790_11655 [Planctomycetota bacterium]